MHRRFVLRPKEYLAIQWKDDAHRQEIEKMLSARGYLFEYHTDEFLSPEHLIYGNLSDRSLIQPGQYLLIDDKNRAQTTTEDIIKEEFMLESEYLSMIAWRD